MKILNENRFFEEEKPDEMQRTISSEIGAKCLRVWYVLNGYTAGVCACLAMFVPQIPAYVYMLCFLAVMYICLAVYDLKAADKGVLTAFTGYKPTKSGKGMLSAYRFLCLFIIAYAMFDPASIFRRYIIFWAVSFIMALIFDMVSAYARKKNDAVIKEQFNGADDEE